MTAPASAASAVATELDKLVSPLALTLNTNLFVGRPDPGRGYGELSVWCCDTGGSAMGVLLGGAIHDDVCSVQVEVQAGSPAFDEGAALALACLGALRALAVSGATPPTGFLSLTPREGMPQYLGPDDARRHRWAFNADLRRQAVDT